MMNGNVFAKSREDVNASEITMYRLAYIDFKLRFTGEITRSNVKNMFDIADASASRIMSDYLNKYMPGNMKYNAKKRVYDICRDTYKPLLNIKADIILDMLANGFSKGKYKKISELPSVTLTSMNDLMKLTDVEKITRAMSLGYVIDCDYISASSNNHSKRTLVPLNLIFDGAHWNFRAFYRKDDGTGEFKTFRFSRTINVKELVDSPKLENESLEYDKAWFSQIPLLLNLHENLSSNAKAALRADYGLDGDSLVITERAALLWYIKTLWHVDTSDIKEDKEKKYYQFRLANLDIVNKILAPLKIKI